MIPISAILASSLALSLIGVSTTLWYSLSHRQDTQLKATQEALMEGLKLALTDHVHASKCIDPLPSVTPSFLAQQGWLTGANWEKTPWQVALGWERVPHSDFVVLSVKYTAPNETEGLTLRDAAVGNVSQWRYDPESWSLSVKQMVSVTESEWAMIDFNMESGCYASYD